MQLNCPNCRQPVPAQDINISQLVAKCRQCGQVFSFEEKVRRAPRQREEVLLPPGIQAFSLLSELNIEVRWRESSNSFLMFFTLIWNAFIIPFVVIAISSGQFGMLLGLSLHLLVGVGLIYNTLATLLNTTTIILNHYRLSIQHQPLRMPFYPNRELSVAEVEQFYVDKYSAGKQNGNPVWAYAVKAELKDGEHLQLVKRLKNPNQARYIEQEMERFLDMKDRPVEGEWLP